MTNISISRLFSLNLDVRYVDVEKLPANVSYSLNFEASVAVSTISLLTFIIMSLLLLFYYRGDDKVGNYGSPNNQILLFLGIVISIVTSLSVPNYDANIYRVYVIVLLIVVGVVVTVMGSYFFFKVPKDPPNERPMSYNHESLSTLIWVITIPLALMELLEFIGAIAYKVDDYKYKTAVDVIAIIQKLTQASLYHFSLRHKMADNNKKEGASWYLRIISLFNFAMWLDSMIITYDGSIKKIFGQGWSIISTANIALLIDYRLLCCLLFAEHAVEISEEPEEEDKGSDKTIVVQNKAEYKVCVSQMSGLGYVFGCIILALQLVSGLQNYNLVGVWSNIFSIFADIFVVVLGLALISLDYHHHHHSSGCRKSDAKGVDLMVAMMGIIGFLYWIVMAIFNGAWVHKLPLDERSISYLKWSCAKNVVRSLGIVFQLYIFIKCDTHFGYRERVKKKMAKHFILPALMFSFLSVFVMAIMDGHAEIVEVLLKTSSISPILLTLMKVSEPLYLGYCLHLFLHFFVVYNNVRSLKIRLENDAPDTEDAVQMEPLMTT